MPKGGDGSAELCEGLGPADAHSSSSAKGRSMEAAGSPDVAARTRSDPPCTGSRSTAAIVRPCRLGSLLSAVTVK
jgi:hypothetical protein